MNEIKDHRQLGKELEIFKFSPYAPGVPFFLPKGVFLYNQLLSYIRELYEKYDYQEIMSPLFMNTELWKKSGHYEYYHDNMYFLENEEYALKPMNCPAHMVLFDSDRFDKNQLPVRIADFGKLFRKENSGSISGLTRVKSFSQDDGHVFLAQEQLKTELNSLISMIKEVYNLFGFTYKVYLSGRPVKSAGDDDQWNNAETILKEVLIDSSTEFEYKPGEGAFYGPKIDFEIADAFGKYIQLGTIQLDFELPKKFELRYFDNNVVKEPVVIHRAILGSLERFIAIYLEHCQGKLPVKFSKVQAHVIVLNHSNIDSYKEIFKKAKLRYEIKEVDNIKIGIKQYFESKVPYLVILGNKEIENSSLTIKSSKEQKTIKLCDFENFWKELQ